MRITSSQQLLGHILSPEDKQRCNQRSMGTAWRSGHFSALQLFSNPPPVLCSSSKQRAFATRSLQPLPFHKRVLESDGSFLAGTTQPDERRVRRSQLEPVLSLCSAFQEKLLLCISSLNASILTARTPGSHLPGHWVPWGCCTQWGCSVPLGMLHTVGISAAQPGAVLIFCLGFAPAKLALPPSEHPDLEDSQGILLQRVSEWQHGADGTS